MGAGTLPSLALGRAGRPGRPPPPPRHWGVAGEGRGSRSGRPSLRGGSRAQVRRRPRDLRDPGSLRASPRGCDSEPCRGPERGGAPNFWPGSAGSAELGQTTKATAGLARVLTRGTGGLGGERDSASPASAWHELGLRRPSGGRWARALGRAARWPAGALCSVGTARAPSRRLAATGAAARLRLWPGAAAQCLPRGVSVPPPPLSRPLAVCGFQVDFLGGWLLLC